MLKKVIPIVLLSLLLITAGCNADAVSYDYTYSGQSEHWTGEYHLKGSYRFTQGSDDTHFDSGSDGLLTVSYKGDIAELSSVKNYTIAYECISGGGKMTEEGAPDKRVFTFTKRNDGGVVDGTETITVSVTLDGQTETFKLQNVQKQAA